ncbi:uncharacterized protein CXQ87_003299 [Candidozyma duobushaemuli]|uniref:Major facilitator superfamily (MFS) profile domain-containing protein n=2 Tax=Candidozyma TaxID=3303203 RepID=A0ABX8I8A1_9ASCO|nr:uncharacterized protein CXQ87_003299 [[Candida] duobushaemulonis]PVH15458.1 hypothetical protein CXQ87_003299 [[Candida] duobushaemulonis]QWU88674.1 hypothetical protein CA3LBN_002982 [[Candida] haemuloni]
MSQTSEDTYSRNEDDLKVYTPEDVTSREEDVIRRIETNTGVQSLVHSVGSGIVELGPLEEPYDVQRVETHPDPNTTYHEADEWKYPIDKETQMRIVHWVEGDKQNPKNFGSARKWVITLVLGFICFIVAFGSAVVTGDMAGPSKYFGVSEEVYILAAVTVFVLGFGFGPLVFAPFSEELGRQPVYLVTLGVALVFIIPCAVAKNIGTMIVCRLIDGIAFSAPMCLIGGSLADIWDSRERGKAMAVFSAAPFLGPAVGPVFGGLIGDYGSTWRWIYWTFLICGGFGYIILAIFVPETHHQTLLRRRAKKLRKLTGDDSYRALSELKIRTVKEKVNDSLLRPFILLTELIVFLVTMYMAVIYGLLYMFFFAYPVVYMEGKGWSASMTGVMFLPIAGGCVVATLFAPLINKDYIRKAQPYVDRGELPPPELRLRPMLVACWFVPAGLFAFAWSSYPHISWAGPAFSGFGCGIGFLSLYNPANNYIVDSYQHYAASALAAKTFVRSIWGACVPLFTMQMYHRLGDQWATSLMAFIALACCLIPYAFYIWGAKVREFSRYAYTDQK